MYELIKVTNNEQGEPVVSGRELHEFLDIATPYTQWFERMKEYGFAENIDFIGLSQNCDKPQGGRPTTEHVLTLNMAKEISMIQRNEKGKQARQYFIEIEKRYRQAQTPAYIDSKMLFQLATQLEAQEKQIALLETEKSEMIPKVEFFDAVTDSTDAIDIGEAAKVLNMGIGRNKLFEFLRDMGVLQSSNQPYQKHIDTGHFRTIEQKYTKPDGSTHINIKTVVYQKGLDYIRKLLNNARG